MPKIYIKSVPSSEWSNSSWDNATSYNVGDRITYDDGAYKKLYTCIQSHSSSIPQTNGDAYWARIGSEEYPYYAVDGRLDTYTSGEVYLESINARYRGSGGTVWPHATEDGTVPGEIILEDGEYFQPTSALLADGIDITALNTGKVTINHFQFNYAYVFSASVFSTHRSKITGINLIMGGGSSIRIAGGNAKILFDQCKLTDENCPYGPANGNDFRIGNANHLAFKNTLCYFPNATAPLLSNGMQQHEGKLPVWENSTFALGFGSGNNYSPLFYSAQSQSPYVKNCIFYATHLGYTSSGPINITHSASIGESNVVYSASNAITFTEVNDGFKYLNPEFVDPGNGNLSLRPSSPLIGGIKDSNSNPAGVYIQPGSSTGGSGTFEDPYYMAELDTAETEAAAGNGIIYFVDGEYTISNSLNLYADGITYKSLNKHKAILGSSDTNITSARKINIGGQYGAINLGVGNITLEDFYIKNTRFQQATNSPSRPNKIKGLKVEDTHPISHATDGFLWSYGKLIIDSCFIYLHFGQESSYYLTRSSETCEILDTTLILNFPQTSGHVSFVPFQSIENSIIYATTEIPESGFPALTANSKNCCFYNIGTNVTYGGENTYQGDPKFADPNSKDFRLRADSPLIGGINQSKYPVDAIWIQPGSGIGSGTEDDPYYWAEYSAAFLAAVQSSSKQLIFKDGTYTWTNAILRDDNVGNNITMVAENLHQAIFTDQGSRISSAGKNPTLRFKDIQMVAIDHFTWQQECHYIFDSVHFIGSKYMGALSVTASGCIFEVETGKNTYIFNNSGPVDIANCIFVDHNDRSPISTYLTDANSGTIKNTIFYAKYPRTSCIKPNQNAVLINCASENITNPEDGILFNQNLGFLDVENKNYSLRPLSPLIGRGQ